MHILERITNHKKRLLNYKIQHTGISQLESMPYFTKKCYSLTQSIKHTEFGIIAEHKRRSPSKPMINFETEVIDIACNYQIAEASGMSVLTDQKFFGGSLEDLMISRIACDLPILRKDFIVNEYQIIESKAYGADVILLIAACLDVKQVNTFSELARSLGMQTILEVHNKVELETFFCDTIDIIGVNNRNLKTFEVDIQTSIELEKFIPNDITKISESGIKTKDDIYRLKSSGYNGFLLGEHFMSSNNPGQEAIEFIKSLKSKS